MKKFTKFTIAVLILTMTVLLCGCDIVTTVMDLGGGILEDMLFATDYDFTDVVLTQKGVNEFEVSFTANAGTDDVEVYVSKSFSSIGSAEPETITKTALGKDEVRITFTREFPLGEDQYLWLVCGEKEAYTAFTIPSAFPTVSVNDDGSATFNFKYTYGVDWGSFCDQTGKAIYYSEKNVFDDSAVLIEKDIALGQETYDLPADVPENVYFYSVAYAKDGTVTNISCPVMHASSLMNEVTGISAKIFKNSNLCVEIAIPETSALASQVTEKLQIMVKNGSADEIYVAGCSYANGVATILFDCTQLVIEGNWYDVLLCWNGTVIMDVPTQMGGSSIVSTDSGKADGVNYKITDWNSMMKVYYETDPQNANLLFESYSIRFDAQSASLIANVTLKEGVASVPALAITGGDKNKIASCRGVKNDDGSYTYTLCVEDALTESGKWYDIRFFVDAAVYEVYKSEGIAGEDFSAQYQSNGRVYEFKEWADLLKIQFTSAS